MPETLIAERYSLANVFDLPGFVETGQVRQAMGLCQALRETQTLGTLVGLPGVGKTWAAQHIAQHEPEPRRHFNSPVLFTTADVKGSARAFLANLLNCLGPDYRAPVTDMSRLACCWIHRRMVELIIIDEAARLDRNTLEAVRDIHDRTHCAFLFIGQPELPFKLSKNRALNNRISLNLEMVPLTYDELTDFVRCWQRLNPRTARMSEPMGYLVVSNENDAEDIEIMKEMYRVTLGNLRRVYQFIQQVERIARLNNYFFVPAETARAVAVLFSVNEA